MKRIGLVSGPTGGHILPATVVARELKQKGVKPELISTLSSDHKFLQSSEFVYHRLRVKPWSGSGLKGRLSSFYSMVREFAFTELDIDRYSVVISFGGYPCVPVLTSARLKGIPYFIQEQNRIPGRANSLFAEYSQMVFFGLPPRKEILTTRTEITGNPVRTYSTVQDDEWWDSDRILLVMGGSQGSLEVSIFLEETIGDLIDADWKVFYVKGSYGKDLYDRGMDFGDNFRQVEYRDDLPALMARSTIVWCRAGAGTISELIHHDRPAVLFPYNSASDDHQRWNANWMENQGPALSVDSEDALEEREQILSFTLRSMSIVSSYDRPWDDKPAEEIISRKVMSVV